MNNPKTFLLLLCLTLFGCTATAEQSDTQNFRVRLYFGLSLPQGGGVSLKQWHDFQNTVLAKTFDGFNVVDSTGFYERPARAVENSDYFDQSTGDAKRSTLGQMHPCKPRIRPSMAQKVARQYATRFNQESVMMVKIKVDEWSFIQKVPQSK